MPHTTSLYDGNFPRVRSLMTEISHAFTFSAVSPTSPCLRPVLFPPPPTLPPPTIVHPSTPNPRPPSQTLHHPKPPPTPSPLPTSRLPQPFPFEPYLLFSHPIPPHSSQKDALCHTPDTTVRGDFDHPLSTSKILLHERSPSLSPNNFPHLNLLPRLYAAILRRPKKVHLRPPP
jgi:hypothetical protein